MRSLTLQAINLSVRTKFKGGKVAKPREYFYAGVVLVHSRESTLNFSGVWTASDTDTFTQIHDSIISFETLRHGAEVVLIALNQL